MKNEEGEKRVKESILAERSLAFAVTILSLTDRLRERREYVVSSQIGRSGTSIGANIREAQFAISRADFVAKLHIALKETNETEYWLELLKRADKISEEEYTAALSAVREIRAMLISSIKTAKAGEA